MNGFKKFFKIFELLIIGELHYFIEILFKRKRVL